MTKKKDEVKQEAAESLDATDPSEDADNGVEELSTLEEVDIAAAQANEVSADATPKEATEPHDLMAEKVSQLESQLHAQVLEVESQKDKALRAMAELENFKRRKEQEKQEFLKFANERLVIEFLPIIDNFDHAIQHAVTEDDGNDNVIEGFKLIQKQFLDVLKGHGVSRIEALNEAFDPTKHQAVSQEEKEGVDPDIVISEMQAGYTLQEKVIRPSLVVVSK